MDIPPFNSGKLLVLGHQWPEASATAAGQRMLQLLQGFREAGYHITFGCAAERTTLATDLETMGIETRTLRLNHPSFDAFLREGRFDIALFDRFMTEEQFGWRVRDQLPGCTLVLDTEDLHSLRHSRERALREGRPWKPSAWMEDPLFYRELASMLRADLTLIISRFEMDLLLEHLPFLEGTLCYLPFRFPAPDFSKVPGYEAREGFVFIGNGRHRPNLDAISVLKTEIWPLLSKRLKGAALHIYGAYLPEKTLAFHNPAERFQVHGWIPDTGPVLAQHRLQLAPLRFGAGVKGKILDAIRNGMPSVSTPIGWEGILTGAVAANFQAETPEAICQKAEVLYRDPGAWQRALEVQRSAAAPHFGTSMDAFFKALQDTGGPSTMAGGYLKTLRAMLRHQAFDRVRYLSRWIEAKGAHGN